MAQTRLPLLAPIISRPTAPNKDARMINCLIDGEAIIKRPGMSVFNTVTAGQGRGIYSWNNHFYQIVGTTLYKDGVSKGTVDATGGAYQFNPTTDGTKLVFKNTKFMYFINVADTITQVTDVNFPATTVPGMVYLDGYFVVMTANSLIYASAVEDPSTWPALSYVAAETEPDQGVAISKILNYIVAFGSWSTEIFYDAGNATGSPFSRMDNAFSSIGCASGLSVASVQNTIFWIGQTKAKGRSVYMMNGLVPQQISTPYIDRLLDLDSLAGVYAFSFKTQGHPLYALTLTNTGITLVYDLVTQQWSYFTSIISSVESYFKHVSYAFHNGADILQGELDGNTYTVSENTYQDNSNTINVTVRTPLLDGGTTDRKFISKCEIIGDKVASTLNVRYTNDDYQTYSSYRPVDLSLGRSQLRRLGSFRRRAFEFNHADNTPLRLESAELEFGE